MKAVLLLVDLQNDFLARPGLTPSAQEITRQATALLETLRNHNLPVVHVHTRTKPDGSDAMPHWQRNGYLACVAGSPGASSPTELAPRPDEVTVYKRFFSGFENPALDQWLKQLGIDTVILAGIYLHGCIRATALDAYAKGYQVLIAEDATGSTEPLHAEMTRTYLEGRAATCLRTDALLACLVPPLRSPVASEDLPIAWIDNVWLNAETGETRHIHHNPADTRQAVSSFALAGGKTVHGAAEASIVARKDWSRTDPKQRIELLLRWRDALAAQMDALVSCMVAEVGKPVVDAREELLRGLETIEACATSATFERASSSGFSVRYRPIGTVGVVTPWNNPVAIPLGKIAPALVYGNTVVWKPSPQASQIAKLLVASLVEAGAPAGIVNLVFGDGTTARHMMREAGIDAITVTGSIATGASASALCTLYGKVLQAELGGNNAVIVLADADLDAVIMPLAQSAFSYAGQRCTAIRRFIVKNSLRPAFEDRLRAAVMALKIGHPQDPDTTIGPLISRHHLEQVKAAIAEARAEGARLLCGGSEPDGWQQGCWLEPALLSSVNSHAKIVQQETFGPVAVIQEAHDLPHAIELANDVRHGLVAGLVSHDPEAHRQFLDAIDVGIIKFGPGPLPVHPDAPFGGWKASRIGPPEHGSWNRDFYARPQAIYG